MREVLAHERDARALLLAQAHQQQRAHRLKLALPWQYPPYFGASSAPWLKLPMVAFQC